MKKLLETMSKMKDNRNGKVVTFDFDQTIVKHFTNRTLDGEEHYQFGGLNNVIVDKIKKFKKQGVTVFVVTSRNKALDDEETSAEVILQKFEIPVDGVIYTNGQLKAQKLYELGSCLHYDDDPREREAIIKYQEMFPDFQIVVKDPSKFVKDIQAVSKGIIVTADDKFIIVKRSDTNEWDAPGGHLMDGEEPNYAFWREILEETGLELEEITMLYTTQTTWKDRTSDTFYYFGRIDLASNEIEHHIELQWEVSGWFCGDYDQIIEKIEGNSTQHLDNAMRSLGEQIDLIESYQPHSKNHRTKKRKLIGLGGSKATGAKGLKRVKDFSRSKSAPAGYGVLEEENYSEEGSFTHDGVKYDISKAFSIANAAKKQSFSVSDLEWVLKYDMPDAERERNADLSTPIIVARDKKGRLTVVDGLHRLSKAIKQGVDNLKGVLLTTKDLNQIKIPTKKIKIKVKSNLNEKKKKRKDGIYGGKYYDFSFLDDSSANSSEDGEE